MFSKASNFSQIYLEEGAEDYPLTKEILERFPKVHVTPISRYQEIFNRVRQSFRDTKSAQKLILARKTGPFLYESSEVIQGANPRFFYTTPILNCLYDCDYCFLQGKFNSAHAVIFVNTADFLDAVDSELKHGPLTLSPSYETDLLGFSGISSWFLRWVEFARNRENLTVELRSKSGVTGILADTEPTRNVILSWTLSPQEVSDRYERGTPGIDARLNAAMQAASRGWRVRLCIDPVIAIPNWRQSYADLIAQIKSRFTAPVEDIWIGSFRISTDHLAKIKSQRADSDILFYPYSRLGQRNDIAGYPDNLRAEINQVISNELGTFIQKEKLILW